MKRKIGQESGKSAASKVENGASVNDISELERASSESAVPLILKDDISPFIRVNHPNVRNREDTTSIQSDLDELGYSVVGNILNEDEIREFEDAFWRSLTKRERALKRDDMTTWTTENTSWRGTYGAGQYKHYGMAQEEHCWIVRKNPSIRRISCFD